MTVEIVPDEANAGYEVSPHCYTAIIHFKSQNEKVQIHEIKEAEWIDFDREGLDQHALSELLQRTPEAAFLAVTNIAYSRVLRGQQLLQQRQNGVSGLPNGVQRPALSVSDIVDIAKRAGRRVEISWAEDSSQHKTLAAIFYQDTFTNDKARRLFQLPALIDQIPAPSVLCSQPRFFDVKEKAELELIELLRKRLPAYMVPSIIRVLDQMPLNRNCKIDRRALENNVQQRNRRDPAATEHILLSEAEQKVRQIWGKALHVDANSIGCADRFFDIGGDSISSMKVVLAARECGIVVTVRDVFFLNVREMAQRFFPSTSH